jgi:hypothetical protein
MEGRRRCALYYRGVYLLDLSHIVAWFSGQHRNHVHRSAPVRNVAPQADGPAAIDRLLTACGKALGHPIIRNLVRPALLVGLASLMAVFIAYYELRYTDMLSEHKQALRSYIDGTIHRPAAFRVLIPAMLRGLYDITPPLLFDLFETIERTHPGHAFRFFAAPLNDLSTVMLPYYYYLFLINAVSLLLTCALVCRTYRLLFPDSGFAPFVFAPYMLLLAMIVAQGVGHIYDFPAMLLALLLFFCAVRQWTWRYMALFPLACLTKETAILSTLFYVVYNLDFMDRRRLWLMVGLQLLIGAGIYVGVAYHFRHNVGAGVDYHLLQNVQWLLRPSIFGVSSTLVLIFLTIAGWREKPAALRSTAVIMAPTLIVFFYAAFHGEIRNLYELFPYAALLICRNVELIAKDCFKAPAIVG